MSMLVGFTLAAHRAFAWVCTTALGFEVVPEVNRMPAGSIGSAGRPSKASGSPISVSKGPWPSSGVASGGAPESSSVTTTHPRSGPASATSAAYCGWVIAPTQPVWEMKYSTSAATLRVLVVTATAPTRAHAYQAMTASGQL